MNYFKHKARQPIEGNLLYVTNATIIGALYNLGNYPGYVDEQAGEVKGELYSITNPDRVFKVLDAYEGLADADPEYSREKKIITMPDGKQAESWVYVYRQQLRPEHQKIMNGDYIAFIRNKVSK